MRNNLKAVRERAGLTQQQLADMVGTSVSYISQLESAKRDISRIRSDTMMRFCQALNCKPCDLVSEKDFEYNEDGSLIVEKLIYDPHLPFNIIAEVFPGEYFLLDAMNNPRPMRATPALGSKETEQITYSFHKCVKRAGMDVPLGRAISRDELQTFKSAYGITDDDITNRFVDCKGEIYGEKYKKIFFAIQIKIKEGKILMLEKELRGKGIEAFAVSPDRLNIRIM